jgi:hypothetical protein
VNFSQEFSKVKTLQQKDYTVILTLQQLKNKRACQGQVDLFRQTFGESVEITPALCESVAARFDWNWASANLLTPAASAEYERIQGPAYAEYKRVQGAALAEYERVEGAAYTEYERVCARTFGQLFTGM